MDVRLVEILASNTAIGEVIHERALSNAVVNTGLVALGSLWRQ